MLQPHQYERRPLRKRKKHFKIIVRTLRLLNKQNSNRKDAQKQYKEAMSNTYKDTLSLKLHLKLGERTSKQLYIPAVEGTNSCSF